jgi:hypothetical protein
MSISVKRCGIGVGVLILLMLAGGRVAAQTSTVTNIPQQTVTTGENRLVTKSNTVSNSAADKVDTLGTKAYKGFVNMFKKKKKTTPPPGGTSATPGATTPPAGTAPPAVADTTRKQP